MENEKQILYKKLREVRIKSKTKKKTKVLCLLSGGLDSILALLLLKKQEKEKNLEIGAVQFISPFFNSKLPEKYAKQFSFNLYKIDLSKSKSYLNMILHPKYGYGKGLNPCIDCHIFMLKQAKKLMRVISADCIATGEVAEERPFSQSRRALKIIEKEAGLDGKLLRPLSAKLLEETDLEKEGKISREKLFDLHGKKRHMQIELAKKFNLKNYQQPAGGCILCEKHFAERARRLIDKKRGKENIKINDLKLLRYGRHFFTKNAWIIIGRNEKDNMEIEKLKEKCDKLIYIENIPSPTTLIKKLNNKIKISKLDIKKAKYLTLKYSSKNPKYFGLKPKFVEV